MTRQPGETIKLSQFLKWKGLCGSGGEAKICIIEGEVEVNGEVDCVPIRVIKSIPKWSRRSGGTQLRCGTRLRDATEEKVQAKEPVLRNAHKA